MKICKKTGKKLKKMMKHSWKQSVKTTKRAVQHQKKAAVKVMKRKIRKNSAMTSLKALMVSIRSRHNITVASNKLRKDVRTLLDTDFSKIVVTPEMISKETSSTQPM